jgi:hypothetical protein
MNITLIGKLFVGRNMITQDPDTQRFLVEIHEYDTPTKKTPMYSVLDEFKTLDKAIENANKYNSKNSYKYHS